MTSRWRLWWLHFLNKLSIHSHVWEFEEDIERVQIAHPRSRTGYETREVCACGAATPWRYHEGG